MKLFLLFVGVLILVGSAVFYFFSLHKQSGLFTLILPIGQQGAFPTQTSSLGESTSVISVFSKNLDVPWAIAFLPNGDLLITERAGRVRHVTSDGTLTSQPVAILGNVKQVGEGGLQGITLDPDFSQNNYVYLYYTYDASGNNTKNRVVRMTYSNRTLRDETIILDAIPGASNHDGGRIKFGPDGNLYIGTGDAQEPTQAQNKNTLGGKILRITNTGKPAPGNPFNNEIYSYGHRNVQGLSWNTDGALWATEHGRSGAQSGLDELNLIESGKNYGWPDIEGDETASGMVTPVRNSGNTTWAPSGADFIGNSLFFAGLRGQTLYEAVIDNEKVTDIREHLNGEYGRLREVVAGPDGFLYVTTSNRDGRGVPKSQDDIILRIDPKKL